MEVVSNLNLGQKIHFVAGLSTIEGWKEWWANQSSQSIIGFAAVGRSNVGKSSLINALFNQNIARISKTPGRTQQINVFKFFIQGPKSEDPTIPTPEYPCYLFDLPGHGYAQVSKEMRQRWQLLMEAFFRSTTSQICFLQIQDARHPHTPSDQQFNSFFQKVQGDSFLIFNKIDKLTTQKERAQLDKQKSELCRLYPWVKQIHFVSSETHKGLPELKLSLNSYFWAQLDKQAQQEDLD